MGAKLARFIDVFVYSYLGTGNDFVSLLTKIKIYR